MMTRDEAQKWLNMTWDPIFLRATGTCRAEDAPSVETVINASADPSLAKMLEITYHNAAAFKRRNPHLWK